MIEQQLLPPIRPSCRVSGVSPYKLHHDRVQLEGLSPDLLERSHSRNSKDFGHASDSAAPIYARHRIAMVDFNFLWIHLCRLFLIAERSHQITRIATDSNPPAPHASALGCLTSDSIWRPARLSIKPSRFDTTPSQPSLHASRKAWGQPAHATTGARFRKPNAKSRELKKDPGLVDPGPQKLD